MYLTIPQRSNGRGSSYLKSVHLDLTTNHKDTRGKKTNYNKDDDRISTRELSATLRTTLNTTPITSGPAKTSLSRLVAVSTFLFSIIIFYFVIFFYELYLTQLRRESVHSDPQSTEILRQIWRNGGPAF